MRYRIYNNETLGMRTNDAWFYMSYEQKKEEDRIADIVAKQLVHEGFELRHYYGNFVWNHVLIRLSSGRVAEIRFDDREDGTSDWRPL